ncbi:MAG: hypothetical protein IKJ41_07125 [Clostridia bacterium]|nr:hypothetical protein [Clostridia bacterium]
MTNLMLNEAINLVDDDLISDAYSFPNSKKKLSVYKYIAVVAALVIILTAVVLGTKNTNKPAVESTTTSADVPLDTFYIDNLSDAGFGYKYCYADKSMSGNVGIANADGSILLNPAYVNVHAVSQDRFIARKFVEQSAHSALVNENGKEIIAFFRGEIRRINNISDGAEPVLSVEPFGEKAYFADLNGQKITDYEFNGTGFTETGLIYGYTDTAYYIFDDFCNLLCVVNEGETEVVYALNSKYNLLVKNHGNRFRYGVEKADGTQIISCDYDEINVISDDCIVARIGEAQSNSPDDIVRIFDRNGTQLSTDGEFNSVAFNESGYGIACKLGMGVIKLETRYWLVNKEGKKVSDVYDNIKINEDNEFFGVKNNTETKIIILE